MAGVLRAGRRSARGLGGSERAVGGVEGGKVGRAGGPGEQRGEVAHAEAGVGGHGGRLEPLSCGQGQAEARHPRVGPDDETEQPAIVSAAVGIEETARVQQRAAQAAVVPVTVGMNGLEERVEVLAGAASVQIQCWPLGRSPSATVVSSGRDISRSPC
jgi:hypothetical protein